jgi:hypothetical protein
VDGSGISWSVELGVADWVEDCIGRVGKNLVSSVMPDCFSQYRVLRDEHLGYLSKSSTALLAQTLQKQVGELPIDCVYCVWEGYGPLHNGSVSVLSSDNSHQDSSHLGLLTPEIENGPRAMISGRSYYLYAGLVDDALALSPWLLSPNFWWSRDRSWFVATPIDTHFTFIGGSNELGSNLSKVFSESWSVQPTDDLYTSWN